MSFFFVLANTKCLLAAPAGGAVVFEEPEKEGAEQHAPDGKPGVDGELSLEARSAILMEKQSGQILYEKNSQEQLAPASVTKVMTLLLIFDAIDSGKIHMEDEVTTSEYAASMGGSQVFLEPGEVQTVETLIKCIAVSSANDACVTMAEYISGSEETFVRQMNERAQGLGMERTVFHNCNGLDTAGHVTTAEDIARMSRELITKHPEVEEYATIWMDTIVHTTKKGSTEFGLANTNKLIRQYEYATGLKTGSTSEAGFCLSATARKDNVELISVVMACPDAKTRVKDSIALLNYGFGKCTRYEDREGLEETPRVKVKGGMAGEVEGEVTDTFAYTDTTGSSLTEMEKKPLLKKELTAPVKKGDKIGELVYLLGGKEVGSVPITARSGVEKMTYEKALYQAARRAFML